MRVLGLVPARGGSKGVPGKNIRLLRGKPLLQYTAEAALNSQLLSRVILSTESTEIAEIGARCGLEVPFMRPLDLAADETPMLPVVKHALKMLDGDGSKYDAVCLLQPTNPLRRTEDIDGCITWMEKTNADAVVTTIEVPAEHNPHWVYFQNGDGLLRLSTGESVPIARRQDLPRAFHREGSVYVARCSVVREGSLYGQRLAGYPIERNRSVNIDSSDDWARAEALLAR
jgi:CMP-N-acetylneuraminic acid synthetase